MSLELKKGLLISEEEASLIDAINCDNASGRHLLNDRSQAYWDMRVAIEKARLARNVGSATDKQLQMLEYQHQSEDYSYWNKLPEDKKLFVEKEK